MAAADFEVPKLKGYIDIPPIRPGAMGGIKSFEANEKIQEALGYPGKLVDGWEQKAVSKMGEMLKKYRSLQVFLDACVHCGACTDKCHYYLGTSDPKKHPYIGVVRGIAPGVL